MGDPARGSSVAIRGTPKDLAPRFLPLDRRPSDLVPASTLVALASAATAAAIGATVLLGWNIGSETLIAVRSGYIPVQYNTALAFLASAVALLALLCRRRRWAALAAGAVFLLAGATAVEYLVSIDLGIDSLFFRRLVSGNIPGRMAPNTVVAFLCVAVAMLLLAWRPHSDHAEVTARGSFARGSVGRGSVAACLCAFVAAVGAVAFIGYLANIPSAYSWSPGRPIAVLTTVGFLALSTGVLAACWHFAGSGEDRRHSPRWFPAPLFVLLMSVCGMIAKSLWDVSRIAIVPQARQLLVFSMVLILVFGAAVSGALVAVIRLATNASRRSRDLHALNQALDAESERRRAFAAQAQAERRRFHEVLNALPCYVVLIAPDYTVPFANRYFQERFGRSEGRRCYEYLFHRDAPCDRCESFRVLQTGQPHHWEWLGPDGRHYDIHDFPFDDAEGRLILESGTDITEQRQAEAELKRLNRALLLVSACNQAIAHAAAEAELLHNICELAVTTGGYRLAWVGFTVEDDVKSVHIAAKAGEAGDYVGEGFVSWADEPRGRGPTGTAIRTARLYCCDDVTTDPTFLPWRDRALRFGLRSTLVIPMLRDGRAFGALSLYSSAPNAFHAQEQTLFTQFVEDLTFGIETLRTREAQTRAEAALAASEARYRSLTIATAQVVWVTDSNGLVHTDMPTWREFTGATVDELQGWGWLGSLHPEDRERTERTWSDAVARRRLYETEYRLRRHDGEYRHMWVRGVPVLEAGGQIREWVGSCTDITERKRADQKLRDQAALLDLAPAAIFVRDLDSRITYWSRGAEQLYGWNAAEALGCISHELLGTEFPEPLREIEGKLFRDGVWEGEVGHAARDGRRITVATRWALRRAPDGTSVGFLEINLDISARKQAEEERKRYAAELERSNSELQEFAFVASHDLQEPLRKITAFSERLQDRAAGRLDETCLDYLHRMHSAAGRMATLINSLLDYSRVATRAFPFETVDLGETLLGIVADLEQRIQETHARVIVHTLPQVAGDPAQLRRLFQNLLANALKFHAAGASPLVEVRAEAWGDRWKIAIADNGIGFDPVYAEKIFRPFQRLHGRNEYEGSGMGLAICRKIAQRHGAPIDVTSKPGAGATFTVSLPAAPERTEPCPKPPCESSSPKMMTTITC